jgi:hypothetical protein
MLRFSVATLLALSVVVTLSPPSVLAATNMTDSQAKSYGKCVDWCNANNKTNNSFHACTTQCYRYWTTHKG